MATPSWVLIPNSVHETHIGLFLVLGVVVLTIALVYRVNRV